MRQASMAMSCVAEANAISPAAATASKGATGPLDSARKVQPATSTGCTAKSHPRRRPNRRNGRGGGTWSSTGAHRNFNV